MKVRLRARPRRPLGLLLAALLVLAAFPLAAPAAADTSGLERYAGQDRYATAAAVSAATFAPGVPVAYVATGVDFPDALAAAAAAAATGGPVLLVTPDSIPPDTAAELARLTPARIVVLGSPGAIALSVETALQGYTSGSVQRLAGPDRYATSAAISAATFGPGVPAVYIATGSNFPDALAGAAAAGREGAPILLVGSSLPPPVAAELRRLAPARIVILGSTSVVSASIESALRGYTAGPVVRLAGSDRYGTSIAISQASYTSAETVYLATGANFPDALAGAPLGGPLLLTPGSYLLPAVRSEIVRLGADRVVVLGSTAVVSEATAYAAVGLPYTNASGRWIGSLYDSRGVRDQQPDPYACTATAVMMMLNMAAYAGSTAPGGFTWTPTTDFGVQSSILAWERANMTMVTEGTNGSDPHGWRNALNHFGWGSVGADVYRDLAFGDFDSAVKAAIVAAAQFGKPTGLLMLAGKHAEVLNGWDVSGADPRTGSTAFTVNGVYLTDPWGPNGRRNSYVSLATLRSGSTWLRFSPYLESDSPYPDPIDGQIGLNEWYGRYVIVAAVR